jgi:hypothetical protein
MSDLIERLAHCDGKDCRCMAYSNSECACDADWTPAEVYRLRAERDALRGRIEDAPTAKVRGKVGEICMVPVSHDLMGKRVALVVIE